MARFLIKKFSRKRWQKIHIRFVAGRTLFLPANFNYQTVALILYDFQLLNRFERGTANEKKSVSVSSVEMFEKIKKNY